MVTAVLYLRSPLHLEQQVFHLRPLLLVETRHFFVAVMLQAELSRVFSEDCQSVRQFLLRRAVAFNPKET